MRWDDSAAQRENNPTRRIGKQTKLPHHITNVAWCTPKTESCVPEVCLTNGWPNNRRTSMLLYQTAVSRWVYSHVPSTMFPHIHNQLFNLQRFAKLTIKRHIVILASEKFVFCASFRLFSEQLDYRQYVYTLLSYIMKWNL